MDFLRLPMRWLVFLFAALFCLSSCPAQVDDDEEEESPYLQGLVAEIRTGDGDIVKKLDVDLRHSESELRGARGHSGISQIRWTGYVLVRGPQDLQFHTYTSGSVSISIDGRTILQGSTEKTDWMKSEVLPVRGGMRAIEIDFAPGSNPSEFGLYWSSPKFSLEPVLGRLLWHDRDATVSENSHQGELLSRGLRCAACHTYGDSREPLPAPALTRLSGNLRPSWLVDHLRQVPQPDPFRQMPYFALPQNDAMAIAAAIIDAAESSSEVPDIAREIVAINKKRKKDDEKLPTTGNVAEGARLVAATGCLACHHADGLGQSDAEKLLFAGEDLSKFAVKRTSDFAARWLSDPKLVNADHRMPKFELSAVEQLHIAKYLNTLGAEDSRNDTKAAGDAERGAGLIAKHRCGACHQLPASLATPLKKIPVDGDSNWQASCLTEPNWRDALPGFGLAESQIASLRKYISQASQTIEANGQELVTENNCLACHTRDANLGIEALAVNTAEQFPELATRLPALIPPSLTSIGDKLHRDAIVASIRGKAQPIRPWLDVRMPRFGLTESEANKIAGHFISRDRIPFHEEAQVAAGIGKHADGLTATLLAGRLVTGNGFGCQSCHKIGDTEAPKVDLKAMGPDLAMLGDRIRESWFHRWVRDPARIVPRMEMPAIKTPARGLLGDSLDLQLEALWDALNTPGFRPPKANPASIVRSQNLPGVQQRPSVLTDVFETELGMFLRPIVVGLENRHNALFDLETGSLAAWWLGDTAHQRTRGKTWYWEPGNAILAGSRLNPDVAPDPLKPASIQQPLLSFSVQLPTGEILHPTIQRQVAVHLSELHVGSSLASWKGRITLQSAGEEQSLLEADFEQRAQAIDDGLAVHTSFEGLPDGAKVLVSTTASTLAWSDSEGAYIGLLPGDNQENAVAELRLRGTLLSIDSPASAQVVTSGILDPARNGERIWMITSEFRSRVAADQFPIPQLAPIRRPQKIVADVPGFEAEQLPVPISEMPISLAWSPAGRLFVGSLKGNVLEVVDADGDGVLDDYRKLAANFPTPYGLWVGDDYIDVLTKFALIRLRYEKNGYFQSQSVLCDDWGYTHDYHDWTVGLERDASGSYYIAIPCQQDDRTVDAARRRGTVLKLVPSQGSEKYVVEEIAGGLRFPMGIALSKDGELFTSDNQGNYNPFNELNHIRYGKRYGFINKLENREGFNPPLEPPAINLPHPWTRSVNGICFLDTPEAVQTNSGSLFGPFEGHLIGCEMNGRSLVRMSLQRVGDTYQGAAYMFSRPVEPPEVDFEGPIVCEVAPDGDIYVGNLQDSGWGGGQNTGSLVRIRRSGDLPPGIAEVRATHAGFEIEFTTAMPKGVMTQPSNYSIRSYRRISTPAYGGDDQDSRTETIASLDMKAEGRAVSIQLPELRRGFVYEIDLDFTDAGIELFPSQAHYSMRVIPDAADSP